MTKKHVVPDVHVFLVIIRRRSLLIYLTWQCFIIMLFNELRRRSHMMWWRQQLQSQNASDDADRTDRSRHCLYKQASLQLKPFDAYCCYMGTAIKHPLPDMGQGIICNLWHPGTRFERQSAWMSKITNYGLTLSGRECLIAVPVWQQ